jgi:VWFA-related protein
MHALAGGLGGAAAWAFILALSGATSGGLLLELALGGLAGLFIGAFLWSHEAITGRQFGTALRRAGIGGLAGIGGGAVGAGLGNTFFSLLGKIAADLGGFRASLGVTVALALGWAVLGAAVGASGGIMIRSRERVRYGVIGGAAGGFAGGILLNAISATNAWSALGGLFLLGGSTGGFISLVEEAFVSARVKVIKGRHVGREFPILKDENSIGRDDRADVCLSGAEGVGLEHAVIRRKKGSFLIEAGNGGTGLYVNHGRVQHSKLTDGDIIRVGSILLMFNAVRRAAAVVLVALSLIAGVTTAQGGEARNAQISQFDLSAFPSVKAYVSVLDGSGKPVPGLTARDLSVRENGAAVAIDEMRPAGAPGTREPLSLSLVIDRSGSMTGEKISRAKESVLRFVSLMESGDRASLFAFSDDVEQIVSLTDSQGKLRDATVSVQPGGHTALYDAIEKGVASIEGKRGRRAVIVLSDGIANRGTVTLDGAIEYAAKRYVSVYVIGLGGDVRTARLERIASETGGSYFFAPSPENLASIYETISRRIRNEYVVTYDTTARGEYLRNVAVSVDGGPRAARAYFQPASSLFGSGGDLPWWAFIIPLASAAGLMGVSLRNIEKVYGAGHLSVVRGHASKKEVDIANTVMIGRDERNALGLFRDNSVAQYHAEVTSQNGTYRIMDKGSPAGTFVNRQKVAGAQTLRDGDIVTIGSAQIVFSEGRGIACPSCGAALRKNAKFCPKCGVKKA